MTHMIKDSYDQNMTVSTVFAELLILLSQNVLWRNGIVVFKGKVRANLKMRMLMNGCPDDIF